MCLLFSLCYRYSVYLCQLCRYWAKLIPSRGVWPILEGSALKGYLAHVSACLWKGWGFSLSVRYCKIPKISPGAYFFQRHFLRGLFLERLIFGGAYIQRSLSTEGNLCFKIDWASLIVGSKFTVLALFYFVFEGNFPSTSPRGAYIRRGDFTEGFLLYQFGGHIRGRAYLQNFTVFERALYGCVIFNPINST